MNRNQLLALIRSLKGQATALNNEARNQDGSPRLMTEAELGVYNAKMAEVRAAEASLARLDEAYVPAETPLPIVEGRSQNPGFVPNPVGEPPAVHTRNHVYSIHRAIERIAGGERLDGMEGELSQELATVRGQAPKGFWMPLGSDPEMRKAMGYPERRDLTTVTGTGAIFNEMMGPMIDFLRAQLVLPKLGVRFLTGMRGLFSIPRQTGTSTGYWLGEEVPAALSNATLDQVPFTPHVCIAATDISRLFSAQSSIEAEQFTRTDLVQSMARTLEYAAFNGPGGASPTGVAQNAAVKLLAYKLANDEGNGGSMTYADTVKMKVQLKTNNANAGNAKWLLNPTMEGQLRLTTKIAPGQAGAVLNSFVWEDTGVEGQGRINGDLAYTTTQMPSNLTEGTATNCNLSVYANWDDMVVALWEGVDTLVNPFTGQLAGTVRVSQMLTADVEIRQPKSFVINSGAVAAY